MAAPEQPLTAVLVHGFHLQAEEWEAVVFGEGKQLGRVPKGILEAIKRDASLIIFGTGASHTAEGVKEGQYILNQALTNKLEDLARRAGKTARALAEYLKRVALVDTRSLNTFDEIAGAMEVCRREKISELVLVSSPDHIGRCVTYACDMRAKIPDSPMVCGVPSDRCFAHSTAADVVIFEPPHRGDRPKVPIHKTVAGIIPIIRNPAI